MGSDLAKSRLLNASPKRICVIKPSALGDVIQTLPILSVVKDQFPDATIDWVISRPFANLLQTHPLIDNLLFYDRKGGVRGSWNLLRQLHQRKFDLVFDLQGLLRSGVMTFATRAPLRVGLESAREGAHVSYHETVPDSGRLVPANQRYWRLAKLLDKGDMPQDAGILLTNEDTGWVKNKLPSSARKVLAIHAGAKWMTKRWPATKFAAIAARAAREYGFRLAIIGGPDEVSLGMAIESIIRERLPKSVASTPICNFVGQTSLRQLAALLQSVDYLLTNDSGPMHLAAAMGTPVCGAFLCTSADRSGPAGSQHQLVNCKLNCAGSYRKRCPYSGQRKMRCKDEVSVERVWNSFTDMVERPGVLKIVA